MRANSAMENTMNDELKTPVATAKPVKPSAPKAAPKAEAFEAFSMAIPTGELPEVFRDAAEKSVKQAKEAYEKFRIVAEDATDMIEDQLETTRSGFLALNSKALDAAKANADATFQFAKDVLSVKTVAEAIELQTAFARKQYELVTAQAKEMQDLVQKVATDVTQPAKDVFNKMIKDAKAA